MTWVMLLMFVSAASGSECPPVMLLSHDDEPVGKGHIIDLSFSCRQYKSFTIYDSKGKPHRFSLDEVKDRAIDEIRKSGIKEMKK